MRRTTTAKHRLTVPITLVNATAVLVTYAQFEKVIISKTIDDVTIDDKSIIVELSEAETKKFAADAAVEIQAKFLIDNEVLATQIKRIPARRILDDTLFGGSEND